MSSSSATSSKSKLSSPNSSPSRASVPALICTATPRRTPLAAHLALAHARAPGQKGRACLRKLVVRFQAAGLVCRQKGWTWMLAHDTLHLSHERPAAPPPPSPPHRQHPHQRAHARTGTSCVLQSGAVPPSYFKMISAFWSCACEAEDGMGFSGCQGAAARAVSTHLTGWQRAWNSRSPNRTMSPCKRDRTEPSHHHWHATGRCVPRVLKAALCLGSRACRGLYALVARTTPIQTRFRSFPRMWHSRLTPSKQNASNRPLPSMRVTCAYSATQSKHIHMCAQPWSSGRRDVAEGSAPPCPSSLNVSSRFASESFFPLRRFLPPLPCARRSGQATVPLGA